MIKVTIDKQTTYAKPDSTIIEVAEQLGIYIPKLCYHKKLGIIASCRICLVEIVGNSKLVTACSTIISDSMQVITNSAKVQEARKAILELMLINHPLDCPTCDKAGACALQDLLMRYGNDRAIFKGKKRKLHSVKLSPMINTEMNRCVHCMRCVKYCRDITGTHDLVATNCSDKTTIAAFPFQCRSSSGVLGNVVDLCPVGALLPKSEASLARNWELTATHSIAPHDCIGANITIHATRDEISRIEARENNSVNETWIADRDRFSYEAINHPDRITTPMFKHKGKWLAASWDEAFKLVDRKCKEIISTYGAQEFGGLISPSATLEELYLFQKYVRHFGSNNVDHRLWQLDFSLQNLTSGYPSFGISFAELDKQQLVFIIGADVSAAQPTLGLKLRKLSLAASNICVLNPLVVDHCFPVLMQHIVDRGDLVTPLLGMIKIIIKQNIQVPQEVHSLVQNITPTEVEQKLVNILLTAGQNKLLLLGNFALQHPQAGLIQALSNLLSSLVGAHCAIVTHGANAAGAWFAGCVPHRLPGGQTLTAVGKNAKQMLTQPLKCYILFGIEECDTIYGEQAIQSLNEADFVVAISCFRSKTLLEIADVLLPMTTFAEMSGTYINVIGMWQKFTAAITQQHDCLPGWEIINRLGSMADEEAFPMQRKEEIMIELNTIADTCHWQSKASDHLAFLTQVPAYDCTNISNSDSLVWIPELSMFNIDPLVRRSTTLQQVRAGESIVARINSKVAQNNQLHNLDLITVAAQNGKSINIPVIIDDRIPNGSIYLESGIIETCSLGHPYAEVSIKRIFNRRN